ncbi:unnamed protein product [Phytophthora fragariaefolia]|uniref:Unnamed protein product n=1 Tax=Phytophthora fragariaefolia TaxID=1490495 RepID=A0A9W6WUC9_9STRA|nr:unnamed protein product [Phytophthora fragariaefolia]
MESLRRQLLHHGNRVSDDDYGETLLGHVARTHRDVVRQFSKHYVVRRDGGAEHPMPAATHVVNALRAKSALDEKIGVEEQKPAGVAACGKKAAQQKQQRENQGKRKRKRGGGGGKKEGKQDSKRSGKNNGKGDTQTCLNCGEVGHVRVNCLYRDSSDEEKDNTGFATSDRKRWQNQSDGDKSKKKKMEAVGCISREALTVSSVSDSRGGDEQVDNVRLTVRNNKQPHQDVSLRIDSVLYKPSAPDNLLSLGLLEKAGWNFKTGFADSQRVAWLSNGRLQLLLLKPRGRYSLQNAVRAVYYFPSLHQHSQLVDGADGAECTGARHRGSNVDVVGNAESVAAEFGHGDADALVRLLRRKEDATDVVFTRLKWLLAQGGKIEVFNADQDREFINNKMTIFLTTRGSEYTGTNGRRRHEEPHFWWRREWVAVRLTPLLLLTKREDDLEQKMAVPIALEDHQTLMREVANALSDNGIDEDNAKERKTAESFRRSTRVRLPNPIYRDFEVDLPASLGIEAVNALMEPQTVQG